jgi:hypothetical protein
MFPIGLIKETLIFFSKDILLFLICLEQHWSLLATFSPDQVSNAVNSVTFPGSNCIPVILYLDSLNFHNGFELSENKQLFLNYEWSKKG